MPASQEKVAEKSNEIPDWCECIFAVNETWFKWKPIDALKTGFSPQLNVKSLVMRRCYNECDLIKHKNCKLFIRLLIARPNFKVSQGAHLRWLVGLKTNCVRSIYHDFIDAISTHLEATTNAIFLEFSVAFPDEGRRDKIDTNPVGLCLLTNKM